jgi:amino acid transporter
MEEEVLFVRKATGLVRTAGIFTTAAISFGYLTTGITYYPSMNVYWFPGGNLPLSYFIGGFIMVWPLFIAMFFTQAMPRSASDYVAVSRVINPTVSFLGTLIQWQNWAWVAIALTPSAITNFGRALVLYGSLVGNEALVNMFQSLATFGTTELLVVSFAMAIVWTIVTILGMRISGWFLNITFFGTLLGVFIGTGYLMNYAMQGTAATAVAWDRAYGAGAWKEIQDVALAGGWRDYVAAQTGSSDIWGWPSQWTMKATLAGALPAAYAWWGMELANQVSGEIKEPSKTFPIAMALVLIFATFWYMTNTAGMMMAFGEHFPMYTYSIVEGHGANFQINPEIWPDLPFFTATIAVNPIMAFIIYFCTGLNGPSGALACYIVCSRVIFALSYDRALPAFFSKVNDRWRTPHWAIIITTLYGMIWLPINTYLPFVGAWNVYASAALRYVFMGWGAIILPYKFPRLFERGYTWKIAGVPLCTIFGVLGTVTATWLFVTNIVNIYAEEVAGASTLVQVFWISFSVVLWGLFYNYYKSKGVDMDKLYTEIPPA